MKRVVLLLILSLSTGAGVRAQDLNLPSRLTLDEADATLPESAIRPLTAARNGVEVAEAERLGAHLRPNPAVSLMSDNYPLFEPNRPNFFNNQQLTLRIDQELELAGRRRLRGESAVAGVAVAEAEWLDHVRRLEFEVRRAYFAVVLAKADVDVAQASLAEIDSVIGLNKSRYEVGEISGGRVAAHPGRAPQVRRRPVRRATRLTQCAERPARVAECARPRRELRRRRNARGGGKRHAAAGRRTAAARSHVAARRRPSRRGLTCARRRHRCVRAETQTLLQRALGSPNMTVGAGYQRNFGADAFVFGVTVPLPIFNRNQGAVARADAERRQAANLAMAAATDVLLDVQQAVNTVDITRARVQYIEREYLQPARESRDIVLAAYRLGSANLMDYLDAQRAFRDTLRTYNRALYEQRLGLFQLAAATGAAGPVTR